MASLVRGASGRQVPPKRHHQSSELTPPLVSAPDLTSSADFTDAILTESEITRRSRLHASSRVQMGALLFAAILRLWRPW